MRIEVSKGFVHQGPARAVGETPRLMARCIKINHVIHVTILCKINKGGDVCSVLGMLWTTQRLFRGPGDWFVSQSGSAGGDFGELNMHHLHLRRSRSFSESGLAGTWLISGSSSAFPIYIISAPIQTFLI